MYNHLQTGALDEFLAADGNIGEEFGIKTQRFEGVAEKPEMLLETYGPSEVVISYCYDNYSDWQGAKIARAVVKSGEQATALIEHWLKNYGKMSGTPLQVYQKLNDIPVNVCEFRNGKRILYMTAKACHPEIPWREMHSIFVAEK